MFLSTLELSSERPVKDLLENLYSTSIESSNKIHNLGSPRAQTKICVVDPESQYIS